MSCGVSLDRLCLSALEGKQHKVTGGRGFPLSPAVERSSAGWLQGVWSRDSHGWVRGGCSSNPAQFPGKPASHGDPGAASRRGLAAARKWSGGGDRWMAEPSHVAEPHGDLMDLCPRQARHTYKISPLQTPSVCLVSMKPVKILRGDKAMPPNPNP